MRDIDKGLQAPYVVEARRNAFEEEIRGKSAAGWPGTARVDAALCNYGFSDYLGTVTYERGMMRGCWIMPDNADNERVLLFSSREEALGYGNTLKPVLARHGYFHCRFCVDKVIVHISFGNRYAPSLANTDIYAEPPRYVLRIRVRR